MVDMLIGVFDKIYDLKYILQEQFIGFFKEVFLEIGYRLSNGCDVKLLFLVVIGSKDSDDVIVVEELMEIVLGINVRDSFIVYNEMVEINSLFER